VPRACALRALGLSVIPILFPCGASANRSSNVPPWDFPHPCAVFFPLLYASTPAQPRISFFGHPRREVLERVGAACALCVLEEHCGVLGRFGCWHPPWLGGAGGFSVSGLLEVLWGEAGGECFCRRWATCELREFRRCIVGFWGRPQLRPFAPFRHLVIRLFCRYAESTCAPCVFYRWAGLQSQRPSWLVYHSTLHPMPRRCFSSDVGCLTSVPTRTDVPFSIVPSSVASFPLFFFFFSSLVRACPTFCPRIGARAVHFVHEAAFRC
jgi:hypothetical protein